MFANSFDTDLGYHCANKTSAIKPPAGAVSVGAAKKRARITRAPCGPAEGHVQTQPQKFIDPCRADARDSQGPTDDVAKDGAPADPLESSKKTKKRRASRRGRELHRELKGDTFVKAVVQMRKGKVSRLVLLEGSVQILQLGYREEIHDAAIQLFTQFVKDYASDKADKWSLEKRKAEWIVGEKKCGKCGTQDTNLIETRFVDTMESCADRASDEPDFRDAVKHGANMSAKESTFAAVAPSSQTAEDSEAARETARRAKQGPRKIRVRVAMVSAAPALEQKSCASSVSGAAGSAAWHAGFETFLRRAVPNGVTRFEFIQEVLVAWRRSGSRGASSCFTTIDDELPLSGDGAADLPRAAARLMQEEPFSTPVQAYLNFLEWRSEFSQK